MPVLNTTPAPEALFTAPKDLRESPHWTNTIHGKGKQPSWSKAKTWEPFSFNTAVSRVTDNTAQWVGYCFSDKEPFILVDFDLKYTDKEGVEQHSEYASELTGSVLDFFNKLKGMTYVETSPSGHGYHAIFKLCNADIPAAKAELKGMYGKRLPEYKGYASGDLFTSSGFCIITGDTVEKAQQDIAEILVEDFIDIVQQYLPKEIKEKPEQNLEDFANLVSKEQQQIAFSTVKETLEHLNPWPSEKIKKIYCRDGEKTYSHYDFWLEILCSVKMIALKYRLSDEVMLPLIDAWSQRDTTGSYNTPDNTGVSGFKLVEQKYKSFSKQENGITEKTFYAYTHKTKKLNYKEHVQGMNLKNGGEWFKINIGSQVRYGKLCKGMKNSSVQYLRLADAREELVDTMLINPKTKKRVNPMDAYRLSSSIEKYSGGEIFFPGNAKEYTEFTGKSEELYNNCFNVWEGFNVDEKKLKDNNGCELWMDYLRRIISWDDGKVFDYILNWVAQIVQFPYVKEGVALVLVQLIEGTGKTFFSEHIGDLVGNHFSVIQSKDHLVGRFNSDWRASLLVGIEEAVFFHDPGIANTLKNIITSNVFTCEAKGVTRYTLDNYARYIFTANTFPIKLSKETRRYQIIEISPRERKNRKYFKAIHHEWLHGGKEAFFNILMKRKHPGVVDLQNSVVETDAMAENRVLSLDMLDQWLKEYLETSLSTEKLSGWNDYRVPADEVYGSYCEYLRGIAYGRQESKHTFTISLQKVCGKKNVFRTSKYIKGQKAIPITKYIFPRDVFRKYERKHKVFLEYPEGIEATGAGIKH